MFRKSRKHNVDAVLAEYRTHLAQQALETPALRSPARQPSFVSDYVVPLLIAATFGILGSSLITLASFSYGDPELAGWRMWLMWFLVITILGYMITNVAVWKLLWVALEHLTGKDLDKSGDVGDRPILFGRKDNPPLGQRGISGKVLPKDDVEEQEEEEVALKDRISQYVFRPGETTMQWFVRVSELAEVGTAARQWEPILGRKRYQQFRDALIGGAWARWNLYDDSEKPILTHGWSYTAPAEEICRQIKQ